VSVWFVDRLGERESCMRESSKSRSFEIQESNTWADVSKEVLGLDLPFFS
jgi:hypothetical protein